VLQLNDDADGGEQQDPKEQDGGPKTAGLGD
jgi:hypothetical protein